MKGIMLPACAAGISVMVFAAVYDPPASPVLPTLAGVQPDVKVLSVIGTSCADCHSANTRWPWYSRIPPFSRALRNDVRNARARMDLSRWQTYDETEKATILAEIGSVVRNGIMPPRRYLFLHPDAKLSPEQINSIYRWTRASRHAP